MKEPSQNVLKRSKEIQLNFPEKVGGPLLRSA